MVVVQQFEMGWLRAVLGSDHGLVPGTWLARAELRPAIVVADVSANGGMLPAEEGCVVGVLAWSAEGQATDGLSANGVAVAARDCARVIKAYGFAYGSELPVGPGLLPIAALRPARGAAAVYPFNASDDIEVSLLHQERLWVLEEPSVGEDGTQRLDVLCEHEW